MSTSKIIVAEGDLGEKACLANSDVHGVGLFAKEDIPEKTIIHCTHYYHYKYKQWVNVTPNYKYNHSDSNANCEILTQEEPLAKALSSLRKISKGEELLVDYTQDDTLEQPDDFFKGNSP